MLSQSQNMEFLHFEKRIQKFNKTQYHHKMQSKKDLSLEKIWSWTEDELRQHIAKVCQEEKYDLKTYLPRKMTKDASPRAQSLYLNHLRLNATSISRQWLPAADYQWAVRSYWSGAVIKSKSVQEAKEILTRETGWKPSS